MKVEIMAPVTTSPSLGLGLSDAPGTPLALRWPLLFTPPALLLSRWCL